MITSSYRFLRARTVGEKSNQKQEKAGGMEDEKAIVDGEIPGWTVKGQTFCSSPGHAVREGDKVTIRCVNREERFV